MESANTPAVLLLNLPPQALGGIDLLSFTTAPRFRGIKNLPPGLHLVFTGTTSTLSVRHGAWFKVDGPKAQSYPQLHIKRWDTETETLEQETSEIDILRHRANLGSIWREGLAPYRQTVSKDASPQSTTDSNTTFAEESNAWPSLSSHITSDLLSRILGHTSNHWSLTSSSSATRDIDEIPGLSTAERSSIPAEKALNFLPIDLKQTWRSGATGRERTDAAQDRSWYLTTLATELGSASASSLSSEKAYTQILAELQFTFLTVLTLNNYSSLQQWRRLLSVVLTCRNLVASRPEFFASALGILRLQLQHAADADSGGADGTGLFDFADEDATFLKTLLVRFRRGVESLSSVSATAGTGTNDTASYATADASAGLLEVIEELDELESFLRDEHGWRFEEQGLLARHGTLELMDGERVEIDAGGFDEEDESGEYAPVVVDLTEEQARALGVERGENGVGEHGLVGKTGRLRLNSGGAEGGRLEIVSSDDEDDDGGGSDVVGLGDVDEDEEEMDLEEMDARY